MIYVAQSLIFMNFFLAYSLNIEKQFNISHEMQFYFEQLMKLDKMPLDDYKRQMDGLVHIIKNASMQEVKSIQSSISLLSIYGSQRNSNVRLREALVERQIQLKSLQRQENNRKNSWWTFKNIFNTSSKQKSRKTTKNNEGQEKIEKDKVIGIELQSKIKQRKTQQADQQERKEQQANEQLQEEEVHLLTKQMIKNKKE